MAITYSPNLKLQRPAHGDRSWDVPLLADLDALDAMTALGGLCVTPVAVPSTTLNVAVAAGNFRTEDGTVGSYAGISSVAVPASATTMLWLTDAGVLTQGSAFPSTPHLRLATIVSGTASITSIADSRVQCMTLGLIPIVPLIPIATKTAAYTLVDTDGVILANGTSGAFTVTLPTAVGRSGRRFAVKRINTSGPNNITVSTAGGELLDGSTTHVLSNQWDQVAVMSNGVQWFKVGEMT